MGTAAEDQALYLPYSHICKTWGFRNHHSSSFFQIPKTFSPLCYISWGTTKSFLTKGFGIFKKKPCDKLN